MFLKNKIIILSIFTFLICLSLDAASILFIINPKSGTESKETLIDLIDQSLDPLKFSYQICQTEGPKHATTLSWKASENGFDIVVAVGGDGTVNEVAKGLIGSQTVMGIIPMGSGNGLAKHLKIPADPTAALRIIQETHIQTIDTLKINDEISLGISGVGFDAHIARKFASSVKRGFWSYASLVLSEYQNYKPQTFHLLVDGNQNLTVTPLLLSFANSSQYGNNFTIAPTARIDDGYFDLIAILPPPLYALPRLLYQLTSKSIDKSPYYRSIRCQKLSISRSNLLAHIDGEPTLFPSGLDVKILPQSLKILTPDQHK